MTMTYAPPGCHLLRVTGPDNYIEDVEEYESSWLSEAKRTAADLAFWLSIGPWDCRSGSVPAHARRLRRQLRRQGIDPLHCTVQVIVPSSAHCAVHGYLAVFAITVENMADLATA
jgi:hypothetical protein